MMMRLYRDETPPDYETCPICGEWLNFLGDCPNRRNHDDPYEAYRDGDMPWPC